MVDQLILLYLVKASDSELPLAMQYLYTISWFMLPLAWIFAYRNALQGLNQGFVPMISGIVELVSRYAVILLFAKPFGYAGVCFADPAAWVTTGVLLMVTYFLWKRKIEKRLGQA